MMILTLVFFTLFGLALMQWLNPIDAKMLTRLESIIFVMIGYYFGRLPSLQNEKTLTGKISRQTMFADAAELQAQPVIRSNEALSERLKNLRVVLSDGNDARISNSGSHLSKLEDVKNLSYRLKVARRILKL